MYLKRIRKGQSYYYIIRESIWTGTCWTYRNLVNLGTDPAEYIHYVGGNGFYFDEFIEEELEKQGVHYSSEELERLFFPFLKPDIQRIISMFNNPRCNPTTNKWKDCSSEELYERQKDVHPFDKRRLHFLRCGRIDIGNLDGRAWKFLNIMLEKSRDERETIIEKMEGQLKPREIKSYVYTAFNLQSYFSSSLLKNHPLALDPEKVDEAFLDALCRLNRDPKFFKGVPDHDPKSLHPYLRKYAIFFFDYEFGQNSSWKDFIKRILGAQEYNAYRRMKNRGNISIQQACQVLEIDEKKLADISLKEIQKVYRKKAKELHPDAGGNHEIFIKLTEAYQTIVTSKALKIK